MPPTVQHQLVESLQSSAPGWALFDPQDRLVAANPYAREAFGLAPDATPTWEQLMRDCHRHRRGVVIDTDDIEAWLARVRQSHRCQPVRSFESDLTDGRWMWVTETTRPDGWVLSVLCDITPLKVNEATLRRARDAAVIAAMTDPLTNLYNRRYIFRRLGDLLDTAQQMRIPLAVAMLDLDHFKLVNDQHGHAAGDGVLQHFAQQMQRQLRPLDAVGRIGGEEFLMLLPNADAAGALPVLERLRLRIGDRQTPPPLPYTFSAGVAAAVPGDGPADLVKRADEALYAAKIGGRDRLAVAGSAA
jgi:diguanylate cyclase (GGDEF)-like protein